MNNEDREIIKALVEACFDYLEEIDFIEKAVIQWYPRYDMNLRLDSLNFEAAASIDDVGRPTIIFKSRFSLRTVFAIPHESIHIAQICKGDYVPFKGFSLWRGNQYTNLTADDPNYFIQQPWEEEARRFEEEVRGYMLNKVNEVPGLTKYLGSLPS
jgi:hypothetical protein